MYCGQDLIKDLHFLCIKSISDFFPTFLTDFINGRCIAFFVIKHLNSLYVCKINFCSVSANIAALCVSLLFVILDEFDLCLICV